MKWNWQEQREKPAFLALADGSVFRGVSFGDEEDRVGEVVFNTGMAGYQEILTDPSYAGQFVVMTYPEIGNTGMNHQDNESRDLFLQGLIIHSLNEPSNWRSDESLSASLKRHGVAGLSGLDTRALTSKLRDVGTLKGYFCASGDKSIDEAVALARQWEGLDGQDYAAKVTTDDEFDWDRDDKESTSWGFGAEGLPPATIRLVAYDYGIKWNILRCLRWAGMEVEVVPAKTPAAEVLARKPDAIFYSNGPADPAAVQYAIENAKALIGKVPVMGICLGHQLLSLACGASTYRLKFGHHGCNHPVKDLATGRVEITSQNHNFAVDPDSIPDCLEVTHINLNDQTVEGIRHREAPMFAVQYHPEAGPGPHDPHYLFDRFREMIDKG
jgi:carbamoyl-phosphate synthase small subunit